MEPVFPTVKVLSELALRLVQLGICPICHKRTLTLHPLSEGYLSAQCSECGRMYIDAEE